MSNIAGHFHPQGVRGWMGLGAREWVVGWCGGVQKREKEWQRSEGENERARERNRLGVVSRVRETEGVPRREEHRSISVPPPSPFRHSHFSPRSALHHSASHPPSFIPLCVSPSFLLFLLVPSFLSLYIPHALPLSLAHYQSLSLAHYHSLCRAIPPLFRTTALSLSLSHYHSLLQSTFQLSATLPTPGMKPLQYTESKF